MTQKSRRFDQFGVGGGREGAVPETVMKVHSTLSNTDTSDTSTVCPSYKESTKRSEERHPRDQL